jgi:hypothetical protein
MNKNKLWCFQLGNSFPNKVEKKIENNNFFGNYSVFLKVAKMTRRNRAIFLSLQAL